jgi:hypothetical protein
MDATGERPDCKCHGEPTRWRREPRRSSGGYWQCVVKARAFHSRYNRSEKGRARSAARYQRRIAAGECVTCGQPSLTVWFCWDCLSRQEDRRAIAL